MNSRRLFAVAAALVVAVPVTANAASEIRVGYSSDALTLDPANHRSRVTETIIRAMYDGVLTRNADMKVEPQLVQSYKQTSPTEWTFTLRPNVKFHDGSVMTADDVAFTFERLIKEGAMCGKTSPRKGLLGPVQSVEKVDDKTVVFKLSAPWPILPAELPFQEVVNKAWVQKVGCDAVATSEDGTGPFTLVQWNKGESIVMKKFADYYGGSTEIPPVGPAKVDRLIYKIIPDTASRVAALLAGDVDIINELPAYAMAQVDANPATKVMKVNGTRTFFVALNNGGGPFKDVRVRQAANYALDKKLIIDKILNGTATPLNGVLSPQSFGFNPDLPAYDYNPDKAKKLLADAGFPNGLDVTLDTEGQFKDIAEAIGSMLTNVGIRTKVVVGETQQLVAKWRGANAHRGDMWLTSWGAGDLDPVGIMEPTLITKGRGNSADYSNAEVDSLLKAGDTEADTAKRAADYQKAQVIVNKEAPWIFLWLPQDIYGVSARLKGWQPSADGRINLQDAYVE